MKSHRLALLVLAAGFCASGALAQVVAYDRSGETVVLRYQEIIGGLAAEDPGPRVEVYGDGRVVVHYPGYMKQAGTYTTQIAPSEVDALVANAVAGGVIDFDQEATAAEVRAAAAKQNLQRRATGETIVTDVSDPSTTVIEATVIPATGKRSGKVVGRARWTGLERDAERYPEVEPLSRLAAIEKKMRALMARDDLRENAQPAADPRE